MPLILRLAKTPAGPCEVSSGLKVAGAGVVAGTAALIAAPVIAAKEDGVTGFFKGLATGVCGAIGLTLGGAVAGATQVARGGLME